MMKRLKVVTPLSCKNNLKLRRLKTRGKKNKMIVRLYQPDEGKSSQYDGKFDNDPTFQSEGKFIHQRFSLNCNQSHQ